MCVCVCVCVCVLCVCLSVCVCVSCVFVCVCIPNMEGFFLAQSGITVLAVGTAWAPMEDLKAMASQPHDRHTYFSREFSGLKAFSQEVVRAICQDFGSNN